MPAPTVTFEVQETSVGRRIFKEQAEDNINAAFETLFNLISNIPSGPRGEQGVQGPQGERWIRGNIRQFQEGLVCEVGNAIYRLFPGQQVTGLFRCLQSTTTNNSNFPSSPTSNAAWELVLQVPYGQRGEQGLRGQQGLRGDKGDQGDPLVVRTYTDLNDAMAAAQQYPNDLIIYGVE